MPTQNLKTRLKDILDEYCLSIYDGDYDEPIKDLTNLLSSELSLVVNELREAVKKTMDYRCSTETRGGICNSNKCLNATNPLSAFDIKYKELQEKNLLV